MFVEGFGGGAPSEGLARSGIECVSDGFVVQVGHRHDAFIRESRE
jgi:hypothetical protein